MFTGFSQSQRQGMQKPGIEPRFEDERIMKLNKTENYNLLQYRYLSHIHYKRNDMIEER